MEGGDHVKKEKTEAKSLEGHIVDVGNVLSALWVRLPLQAYYGGSWLILGGRSRFLWNLRILFCVLYFAFQMVKQF